MSAKPLPPTSGFPLAGEPFSAETLTMDKKSFDLSTRCIVTPDQVMQYRKEGHIVLPAVASAEELDYFRPLILELVSEIARTSDTVVRLEDSSALFTQVTNVWRKSEAIREFVFAKRFAQVAAELMGVKGVRLYNDRVLMKDPGGSATPWHKDHYCLPLATHNTIKMWLALSDIPQEMGAMVFATGTHHGGLFPEFRFTLNTQEIFDRVIRDHKVPTTIYNLKAGDATFHSGDLLHSALENRTTKRREVVTITYYADGTRVLEPDHEHRRLDMEEFLPGLKPGEIAASHLNPLLYESEA
jgi:ectoine hydroxylase-related dioxygenase (phytanoyl-CoA dioxygenase family)